MNAISCVVLRIADNSLVRWARCGMQIDPGPGITNFLCLEVYEVDASTGQRDRHDHIASRGAVKKRINALSQ